MLLGQKHPFGRGTAASPLPTSSLLEAPTKSPAPQLSANDSTTVVCADSSQDPSPPISTLQNRPPAIAAAGLSAMASSAAELIVLSGSRDDLFPVPLYCRPPSRLYINNQNPLLSFGLAGALEEEESKSPQSSNVEEILLTVQTIDALYKMIEGVSLDDLQGFVGKLVSMCNTDEMLDKQRTSTASDFERLPATLQNDTEARLVNKYLAVKSFQRSDANKIFRAGDVRPVVWCRKAIHNLLALHLSADLQPMPWHIFRDATPSNQTMTTEQFGLMPLPDSIDRVDRGYEYIDVYNFLRDRCRSVWQDLTIQHCPTHRGHIECLEISFRFLIFSESILCGHPSFDPIQNGELMLTCLDKLMGGYQDSRFTRSTMVFQNDPALRSLQECLVYKSPYESEFWAYRIITALNYSMENSNALLELHRKIPMELMNDDKIKLAFAAHQAYRDKNAVRYFKIMQKADFLGSVLLNKYANMMRVAYLNVLIGRSRQKPMMPVDIFCNQFGFFDEKVEVVENFCNTFNIVMLTLPNNPGQTPNAVSFSNLYLQPTDLHPKRQRVPRSLSEFLSRRWNAIGISRQVLLDPDFPASAHYSAPGQVDETIRHSFIPSAPSPAALMGAHAVSSIPPPALKWAKPLNLPMIQKTIQPKFSFQSNSSLFQPTLNNNSNSVSQVKLLSSSTIPSSPLQLSPFGAALSGLGPKCPFPLPKKHPISSSLFPSPSTGEAPSSPVVTVAGSKPAQQPTTLATLVSPSSSKDQTPTSSNRRLSFAFEGLVTPPSSAERSQIKSFISDEMEASPLFPASSSGRGMRPSDAAPNFGISDTETSETETKRKRQVSFALPNDDESTEAKKVFAVTPSPKSVESIMTAQNNRISTDTLVVSALSLVEACSPKRTVVKRKYPDSQTHHDHKWRVGEDVSPSSGDESSADELSSDEKRLSHGMASVVQTGAKRRLRQASNGSLPDDVPREVAIEHPTELKSDTTKVVMAEATPTVTVTSCLSEEERLLNQNEKIDLFKCLNCKFEPVDHRASAALKVAQEILSTSLEQVEYDIVIASADCMTSSARHECSEKRTRLLMPRYACSIARTESDESLGVSSLFNFPVITSDKKLIQRGRRLRLHRRFNGPKQNIHRISSKFASLFGSRSEQRNKPALLNAEQPGSTPQAPFSRRLIELLFTQFSRPVTGNGQPNNVLSLGGGSLWSNDDVLPTASCNGRLINTKFERTASDIENFRRKESEDLFVRSRSAQSDSAHSSAGPICSSVSIDVTIPVVEENDTSFADSLRSFNKDNVSSSLTIEKLTDRSLRTMSKDMKEMALINSLVLWVISSPIVRAASSREESLQERTHHFYIPEGSSWEFEAEKLHQFLYGSMHHDDTAIRRVVILFCSSKVLVNLDIQQAVHRSLLFAWNSLGYSCNKVPWDFTRQTSWNSVVQSESFLHFSEDLLDNVCPSLDKEQIACFNIGIYLNVSTYETSIPTVEVVDEQQQQDAMNCCRLIKLFSSKLGEALSNIRNWSKEVLLEQVVTILHSDVQEQQPRLFPCHPVGSEQHHKAKHPFQIFIVPHVWDHKYIKVKFKRKASEGVALLLISAWKRKIESLSDLEVPTFRKLFDWFPKAISDIRTSIFFHPFFVGPAADMTETLGDSIVSLCETPALLENISRSILHQSEDLEIEDYSLANFCSSGDFVFAVRQQIRLIIDAAFNELQISPSTSLMLPYPLWLQTDRTTNPAWRGLPFPPQCYAGWNLLISNNKMPAADGKTTIGDTCLFNPNTIATRSSLSSFGTPPRNRMSIIKKGSPSPTIPCDNNRLPLAERFGIQYDPLMVSSSGRSKSGRSLRDWIGKRPIETRCSDSIGKSTKSRRRLHNKHQISAESNLQTLDRFLLRRCADTWSIMNGASQATPVSSRQRQKKSHRSKKRNSSDSLSPQSGAVEYECSTPPNNRRLHPRDSSDRISRLKKRLLGALNVMKEETENFKAVADEGLFSPTSSSSINPNFEKEKRQFSRRSVNPSSSSRPRPNLLSCDPSNVWVSKIL